MKMLSTTELNDQKSIKSIDSVGSFGVSDPLALPVSFDCDSSDSPSVFCIITCLSFVWQLLSVLAMCLLMAGALSPNWINRPLSGVYLTFDNLRLPSALPAHHPMAAPISSSSSSMSSSASAFIPSSSSLFSESGDQAAFLHPSILAPEDRHTLSAEHESTGAALLLSSLGAFGGCTGLTSEQQTWPAGCRISVRSALEHTQRVDFLWYCGQLAQLLGIFVFFIALTGALVSTCKQSVRRKSVFTIVGTCQAFAGRFFICYL